MQKLASHLTSPNMTYLETEVCEGCGMEVEVYDIQLIGGPNKGDWIRQRYGCKCEDRRLAQEAIKNREQMKGKKMQDIFSRHSLLSRDIQKASFENYEAKSKAQVFAKKVSERYVEIFDLEEPKNLLFYGSFGVGKSHLAKSIADGVMARGFSAIFISVPKLLRKIKATYSNQSDINEDEIIRTLENVDLLVLDDLGAEKTSDWTTERIFDIIDSRQGMHTIYTTNYEPNDLLEAVGGERNLARIINQDTENIKLEGVNKRWENRKKGSDK